MSEVAAVVQHLVGLSITRVLRADFGELGLVLHGDDGRSYLRVGDAAWRLRRNGVIVDGSYNEGATVVTDIVNARIANVTVTAPFPDTTLDLGGRIVLEILATSANHPAWYWFDSRSTCLSVGPGTQWSQRRLEPDDPLRPLAEEGLDQPAN